MTIDAIEIKSASGACRAVVEYDDYYDADRDDVLPGAAYVALYVATDSDAAREALIAAAKIACGNVFPGLSIREM